MGLLLLPVSKGCKTLCRMPRIRPSHSQTGAPVINIQSTLRTAHDLRKNVSLIVLFGSNGNSYSQIRIRMQSIKKPNLWKSEPASARSMVAMAALCSGDFKLYSDTSSITPRQLVIELHTLECVCVFGTLGDFLQVEKWRIDLEEQRVCVKFCFKLGKTFTETFRMLQQAYGEDCLSRTQCHEWYQCFKAGRTSIDDDPKSGRQWTTITLRKCLLYFVEIVA